jgi:hypothetical protein
MQIVNIEWNPNGVSRVRFDDGTSVECDVHEIVVGPHGSWARIVTREQRPRHLTLSKSGNMPAVTVQHAYLPPPPPQPPAQPSPGVGQTP